VAATSDIQLAKKLNIRSGTSVRVIAQPADVHLHGLATAESCETGGGVVFVNTLADVDASLPSVVEAVEAVADHVGGLSKGQAARDGSEPGHPVDAPARAWPGCRAAGRDRRNVERNALQAGGLTSSPRLVADRSQLGHPCYKER
jgi:hypothetical protein